MGSSERGSLQHIALPELGLEPPSTQNKRRPIMKIDGVFLLSARMREREGCQDSNWEIEQDAFAKEEARKQLIS